VLRRASALCQLLLVGATASAKQLFSDLHAELATTAWLGTLLFTAASISLRQTCMLEFQAPMHGWVACKQCAHVLVQACAPVAALAPFIWKVAGLLHSATLLQLVAQHMIRHLVQHKLPAAWM
jgi:hypothetical protein